MPREAMTGRGFAMTNTLVFFCEPRPRLSGSSLASAGVSVKK
jgi:hypothetical protein